MTIHLNPFLILKLFQSAAYSDPSHHQVSWAQGLWPANPYPVPQNVSSIIQL